MTEPHEKGKPVSILLIEDNPGDARLIKQLLSENKQASFRIDIADRLSQGIDRAEKDHYDAVLLDLGLPDSRGMSTFTKMNTAFKHLPIVVLSGQDDESTSLTAVQEGAQDYLVKGQVDGHILWRSIRYSIERKRAERQKDLSLEIMDLLNKKGDNAALIHEILPLIKDFSGCEAVGIRLKEGDDYPYYQTAGFMQGHVELENHLCAYDENLKIIRDSRGNPVLECMCGNIILGRFDSTLPFFTTGGSFWSNCTTELLAATTDEDRQARTRNKCNGEGYESVALIPLKGEDGNIGLLQLNDTHRNRFTSDIITYYESIAIGIGIVLARKQAENALKESEEMFKAMVETMPLAIYLSVGVQQLSEYISPKMVKLFGYTMEDIPTVAQWWPLAYPDETYRRQISEEWTIKIKRAIETQSSIEPMETVVTCKDGSKKNISWGYITMGDKNYAFGLDLTERKRVEGDLQKSYESVKKTLNDAINTMVKIVELRDPYTAGHQKRVADLATAIAREMKLEDLRIDQLRTAAMIHDIGKIYIPSDILSKPGRLSEIEFDLIKTHAQGGYDVVKGMDFPGIVAQAVLQHHERLDGSGYPNRLKGEGTLLEAKILAVSDVIEAMASHRPYRPALGIDTALDEIKQNSGKLYDRSVVDVCTNLFREKSFSFEQQAV